MIDVNIAPNDYITPTHVRNNVVQKICMEIADMIHANDEKNYHLRINKHFSALYLLEFDDGIDICRHKSACKGTKSTRIRSREMAEVVETMQEYGYYVYKESRNDDTEYTFSAKPYYAQQHAQRVYFTEFID